MRASEYIEGITLAMGAVDVVVTPAQIELVASSDEIDAVVSSDDTALSMSGGVSKAILEAAGPSLKLEASRVLPVRMGDVAITAAGRLPVRYVLHAVTLDRERGIRPTIQTLRSIGRGVFGRCEELQIRGLALPLVGVGAAAFPPEQSARLMLESLAEHARNPTALKLVVFCLPDQGAREAFLSDPQLRSMQIHGGAPRLKVGGTERIEAFGASADEIAKIKAALRGRQARASLPDLDRVKREQRGVKKLWNRLLGRTATDDTSTKLSPGRDVQQLLALLQALNETDVKEVTAPVAGMEVRVDPRTASHPERVFPTFTQRSRPLVNNRYVLLEEIGRGGMGIVYLAWDIVLRLVVAIKTLQPAETISQDRIERLRHEAALQMRLSHPGIVRLFHFEPWDRAVGPYLLMEYVPWATGDRWLAEAGSQGLPPVAVVQVGVKLCEALAIAHDAGVLHLDIKPSNVFVDPAGEQPKLGDFGIATTLGPTRHNALVTRLVGTPGYMAPEQRVVGAHVGPWTDVYLLAGTMWELITGEKYSDHSGQGLDGRAGHVSLSVLQQGLAEHVDARVSDARAFGTLLAGALQQALPT